MPGKTGEAVAVVAGGEIEDQPRIIIDVTVRLRENKVDKLRAVLKKLAGSPTGLGCVKTILQAIWAQD